MPRERNTPDTRLFGSSRGDAILRYIVAVFSRVTSRGPARPGHTSRAVDRRGAERLQGAILRATGCGGSDAPTPPWRRDGAGHVIPVALTTPTFRGPILPPLPDPLNVLVPIFVRVRRTQPLVLVPSPQTELLIVEPLGSSAPSSLLNFHQVKDANGATRHLGNCEGC